jgi:hypothetical protein
VPIPDYRLNCPLHLVCRRAGFHAALTPGNIGQRRAGEVSLNRLKVFAKPVELAQVGGKVSPDYSCSGPLSIMRVRFSPLSHALLEIPEVLVNLLKGEAESKNAFRRFAGNVLRTPLAM